MPEPITAVIGGGLMVGGAIASHQSAQDQSGAMGNAQRQYSAAYAALANQQQERFGALLGNYQSTYTDSMDEYTSNYNQLTGQIGQMYESMLSQYSSGMDEAREAYSVGRDNTIAATQQATQAGMQRQTASNAFGGLGNTTFGSQAVSAIEQQGALQEGVIHEQYATGMSNLIAGQTQGMTSLLGNQINQTASMGQHYAGSLAGMQQGFAGNVANLEQGGLQQWLRLREAPLGSQYNTAMQQAQQPTGMGIAGSMLGGIGSGILGGMMA